MTDVTTASLALSIAVLLLLGVVLATAAMRRGVPMDFSPGRVAESLEQLSNYPGWHGGMRLCFALSYALVPLLGTGIADLLGSGYPVMVRLIHPAGLAAGIILPVTLLVQAVGVEYLAQLYREDKDHQRRLALETILLWTQFGAFGGALDAFGLLLLSGFTGAAGMVMLTTGYVAAGYFGLIWSALGALGALGGLWTMLRLPGLRLPPGITFPLIPVWALWLLVVGGTLISSFRP